MQALAQPLLTTIARAVPPDAREMLARHEHRRGLRAVGREDGRRGGGRVGDEQREIECLPFALMPALTPAARNPRGAVTPPAIARDRDAVIMTSVSVADRRAARVAALGVERRVERHDHRVLAALRNCGHFTQSVKIFSGSQRCGTIEKPMWMK